MEASAPATLVNNNSATRAPRAARAARGPLGAPTGHRNKNGARYSSICFTLNNYTSEEYETLKELCTSFKYAVIGEEVGEEGTPHLQCYVNFGKQLAWSSIKALPGFQRVHFEETYGTFEKASNYCKKDGVFWEHGEPPKPGKRNDLADAAQHIVEGKTLRDLVELGHGVEVVKYYKGLSVLRSMLGARRSEPPRVFWLHGTTGVGKTRLAVEYGEKYHNGDYWLSNGSLQWFDGYEGQPVAIFDDFRSKHCSFSQLLRLLDRYSIRVPFKGGFVDFTPAVIFITSPYTPDQCFEVRDRHLPEDTKQLGRRLTSIIDIPEELDDAAVAEHVSNLHAIVSGEPIAREYTATGTLGSSRMVGTTTGPLVGTGDSDESITTTVEWTGEDDDFEATPGPKPLVVHTPVDVIEIESSCDDSDLESGPLDWGSKDGDSHSDLWNEVPATPPTPPKPRRAFLAKSQFATDNRPHKFVKGKKIYLKKK